MIKTSLAFIILILTFGCQSKKEPSTPMDTDSKIKKNKSSTKFLPVFSEIPVPIINLGAL